MAVTLGDHTDWAVEVERASAAFLCFYLGKQTLGKFNAVSEHGVVNAPSSGCRVEETELVARFGRHRRRCSAERRFQTTTYSGNNKSAPQMYFVKYLHIGM